MKKLKRVLYLTCDNITLYEWLGGVLLEQTEFDHNETDRKRLVDIFRNNAETTTYILVDVIEEEYYNGNLPHVSFRNRKSYFKRQKEKRFRDTIYRFGEARGREKADKKDDTVFFSALTEPGLISSWVDILVAEQVSIAGIYSLPILSTKLLSKISSKQDHVLFVTYQKSGLRLSFFQNSKLKISRLTSISGESNDDIAQLANSEIEKTMQYLKRIRLLPPDAKLDVFVTFKHSILETISNIVKNDDVLNYHLISESQIANALKIDDIDGPKGMVQLMCFLVCHNNIANHYASKEQTRFYDMRRLIFPMKAASVLFAVFALSWSTNTYLDSIILEQDSEISQIDMKLYQYELEKIRAALPATTHSARDIQSGLDTLDKLQFNSTSPQAALIQISKVLNNLTDVKINRVEWKIEDRYLTAADDMGETIDHGEPIDPTEIADTFDESTGQETVEVTKIGGTISPFDGNYRQATMQVNKFVEALNSQSEIRDATIITLPLNAHSSASMAGDISTQSNEKLIAAFEVEALFERESSNAKN